MFTYTLSESNKTWNGNTCATIAITDVVGITKTFDDFTYFENEMDEDEKQFALEDMFFSK
jgi:hypothetical protein